MTSYKNYIGFLKKSASYIIIALLSMLVLGMFLGTLHLVILFVERMISPEPYYFVVNIEELYAFFSVILIIVVGYELFKSISIILQHDYIPVKSILKISAIAISNKIITLNIHTYTFQQLIGICIIMLSIGATFFFFNMEKEKETH